MEEIKNDNNENICDGCIKDTCKECFKKGLITEDQYVDMALSKIF